MLRLDVEAVDVVEEAVPRLADDRQAPAVARPSPCWAAATSASRTTPTECVFVSPIGVVSSPESRIHSSPVSSPLPLIRCAPAKSGSAGGTTTVTPVRTLLALDQRRVADADAVDVRDRVRGPGREPADLDPELAGARHSPTIAAPWSVDAPRMATTESRTGLAVHGIETDGTVHWNPTTSQLYTHALERREGRLAEGGPLAVDTGKHTGRSPKDKFVVREPGSEDRIWWGDVNAEISEEHFEGLREKVARTSAKRDLYVVDAFAGADPRTGSRSASSRPPVPRSLRADDVHRPDRRGAARLRAAGARPPRARARGRPREDGTRTGTFVVLHPLAQEVLIGGTFYAGEIKKSIFTLMNDRLPLEGVFPMHCSANVGDEGDVAIFFGLSGTGKTTLSADPERRLVGDDEHGWGESGVFNFEGGCYAKVINLSAEAEPEIYTTTRAVRDESSRTSSSTRGASSTSKTASKTENTRAAYKLEQISNALPAKRAGHPSSVVFSDCGRVRDPAADRAADARPGDVLVPVRLHREARRHRDRRDGAAADLGLLRRGVPGRSRP